MSGVTPATSSKFLHHPLEATSMIKLAKRALEIRPSPTIAMNARASEMKRLGRDVIPLSLGEPDFHTPENIKLAGIKAIEKNFTKYTATDGYAPLKAAIVGKLSKDNGATYTPEQIVVGSGAKVVILAALMSILDPGDEVIIPAPYWVTYPDQVEMCGGKPVFATCTEASGFKLTPETLKSSLSPRTRAIIFNSPNNPAGSVYTPEEIRALGSVLKDHPDVWIVTDELYEHLVYDGAKTASFAGVVPTLTDRIITVNGFSKGYVMTGWRLAFAAGPVHVIKAISDLLSQMTGSANSVAQAAAIEALQGDQSFLVENRGTFEKRRDLVVDRINKVKGLSAIKPSGTFYVYINCGEWISRQTANGRKMTNDLEVAEALLDEAELAVVPGGVFGLSPYFRVSIALEVPLLEKAMDRLDFFAKALR
jgi:aspartate aminotransferase